MANALVQFRADETLRTRAADVCEALGLDLQTYLRMSMARLVQENGIPFSTHLDDAAAKGLLALREASLLAEDAGDSDMSLDEINVEIAASRAEEGW